MAMRVSVTNLEAFRLFRDEEWMTYDRLMASLAGTEPQDVKMAASAAFHDILRDIGPGDVDRLSRGRFTFNLSRVEGTLILQPLRELRAYKVYNVLGEDVTVSGRVDASDGVMVSDHKIKFGQFDAEGYADSMQWRLYLDMIRGYSFNYNVFEATDFTDKEKARWERCPCAEHKPSEPIGSSYHDDGNHDYSDDCLSCGQPLVMHVDEFEIDLKHLHILPLYTYAKLHEDVRSLLADYVGFARKHIGTEKEKVQC